jgi:hypothetical protein
VEIVITVAIIQTTGAVQAWLTAFAIAFAFYIATAFFIILWKRNHVFYGPSEFDAQDPSKFVTGMQSPARNDDELAKTIKDAVYSSLSSEELLIALEATRDRAHTTAILQGAANKAVEEINEQTSVVIHTGKESSNIQGFFPLRVFITPQMTVGELASHVRDSVTNNTPLYLGEYGRRWWLRTRKKLPLSLLRPTSVRELLELPIDDFGVDPGTDLEIIYKPRRE